MKLLLESWRKYVNENKDLFTYIKSGRNRDIFMNYSDIYNIYLDWILWEKKDPAAKAYVDHFREMATKYSETTGESPYWKNRGDIWDVKSEFYKFFDPSDLVAAIKRQQGRSDPGAVGRLTKRLKKDYDSIEAAEEIAKKTNELANQAYKSLMSYRKEFLDSGAITGEEENERIADHLPSAFIYRPFMNPPGYEGTDLAGKVDIRGAHLEQ